MRIGYNCRRLDDIFRAAAVAVKLRLHDGWTRQELEQYQRQQISRLVKHAVKRSPFYRKLYEDINPDEQVVLNKLPVINKSTMMDRFDQFLTCPELSLSDLQKHLSSITRDEYYLNKYRVLTTAGASGLIGIFVFNRQEWITVLAAQIRVLLRYISIWPSFPKRLRVSLVAAGNPRHGSWRIIATADVGFAIFQQLTAMDPMDRLVKALNDFQPHVLICYPSMGALLAYEQLDGNLRIHPRIVATAAEICTDEMAQTIEKSWNVRPFNVYGATEVLNIGVNCHKHEGIHAFEDLAILEVVDENNKPVPDGIQGHKILITNLYNYTQPLIRYELNDMIKMSTKSCSCGRPFRLIERIEGRSDDVLQLKGIGSRLVTVHPIHFRSLFDRLPQIKEYQVVYENDNLDVYLVIRDTQAKESLTYQVEHELRTQLEALGAKCPTIHTYFVEQLQRDSNQMGKLKLVKSISKKQ